MRKLILTIIIINFLTIAKSQNHLLGCGFGRTRYETTTYVNYQFNYKIFNSKVKCSLFPNDFSSKNLRSINDLYIGLKTKDNKFITCYFNFGASFYSPKKKSIFLEAKQQVNPIFNFECAFSIIENMFLTTDISIYQLQILIPQKTGQNIKSKSAYMLFEIGYAYRFKKQEKEQLPK